MASGGVPFPRAWIIQTANKSVDRLRRQTRFEEAESYATSGLIETVAEPNYDTDEISDDRLRLIFLLSPSVALDARSLSLRTPVVQTDEIARAFLVPTTMAQRWCAPSEKIRDAGISYKVPDTNDMPERLMQCSRPSI